jgi:hypothetical protein
MIWVMLIAKHAYLFWCNQGIMTKMFQLGVQCSIYNHERDALLRCMIAMMMHHEDGGFPCTTEMVHMTQCNYHDVG